MRIIVVQRMDTAADWAAKNSLLKAGEFGQETDTGRLKMGDGVTRWNDLAEYWPSHHEVQMMIDSATGGVTVVGDLSDLTTDIKTTIVDAINEVATPSVPFTTLYRNAKAG